MSKPKIPHHELYKLRQEKRVERARAKVERKMERVERVPRAHTADVLTPLTREDVCVLRIDGAAHPIAARLHPGSSGTPRTP